MKSQFLYIVHICLALVFTKAALCQGQLNLSSISITEDSKANLTINGPAGELILQSSVNLQTNSWLQLSRLRADGSPQDFNDPFSPDTLVKFYRVSAVPPADELHLTGVFAAALESLLSFTDLQTAFGLNFAVGDANIPAGNDLSFSSRNARIYSAIIAALSKLAKDVQDAFPDGSKPSSTTIATALAADLEDGNLDGNKNGAPIQIGTTGSFLPAYTGQNLIDALNEVKTSIPGLYNVFFSASGAGAALQISRNRSLLTIEPSGTFATSIPATWGDFYWDSSDWK